MIPPQQFRRQPSYSLRQPRHTASVLQSGLGQGLRACWMPQGEGSPLIRNHVTGKQAVGFGGVSQGISTYGHVLTFTTGSIDTGEVIDIAGNEITIALRLRLPASSTRRLFGNHENSSTGYLLYQNGLTIGCYLNNALVAHSSDLAAGAWSQVAFSCLGGNRLVALDGAVTSTPGLMSVSGTATTVKLGAYNWAGHPNFSGDIEYVALWDRGLSIAELLAFQENPYRLFKAARSWIAISAGHHQLSVASLGVAHVGGAAALSQVHATVTSGDLQANTAASIAVAIGALELDPASLAQENAGEQGAIAQTHAPGLAPPAQANGVAAGAAGQAHNLAAHEIRQANLGVGGAVTRGQGEFAVIPFVQGNTGTAGAISQTHVLFIPASSWTWQENRASAGSITDGVTIEPALARGDAARMRVRKPGVPAGTHEWLKTMVEILTGRRGNRIPAPPARALTFSDTPTRTECEALYAYVNEVREAVDRIITRLDS